MDQLYRGQRFWLFTSWNTVVYYDQEADQLRHGPRSDHKPNVTLVTCGSVDMESSGALLLAERNGEHVALVCRTDGVGEPRAGERPTVLAFKTSGASIHLVGNRRHLCAEADGTVTLSRDHADEWERFTIAAEKARSAPRAHLSDELQALVAQARALLPAEDAFITRTRSAKPSRKCVICNIVWLRTYLAAEHYHFIRRLHEEYHFDIIDSFGTDFANPRTIAELGTYELVFLSYQGEVRVPVNLLNSYVIIRIDDLENYSPRYIELLKYYTAHVDMVVSPYAYEVSRYFPHQDIRWLPYTSAIEEDGGPLPFNVSPREQVLLSGSVAWDRPFRTYVFELDDPRLAKLPHPGYGGLYDAESTAVVRSKWYRELNSYLAAFCDAHSLRYIHLRVFEIASTGALLLADRLVEPEMNQLGFVDGQTCVFCDQSDFLAKVEWILDPTNRSHIDAIRAAGMNLVLERHTTKRRVAEFVAMTDAALVAPA